MKIGMTERDVAVEVQYQIKAARRRRRFLLSRHHLRGQRQRSQRTSSPQHGHGARRRGRPWPSISASSHRGYCSDFGRSVFMGEPRAGALAAYRSITSLIGATTAIVADGQVTPAQIADFARTG